MAEQTPDNYTNSDIEKIILERDFYKRIINAIPAIIHINNLQKETIEWINDYAEKESGYSKEEMLNNPNFFEGKIFEEDSDWLKGTIEDYKNLNGVYTSLYTFKNKDCSLFTYLATGVILDYDDNGKPLTNLCIDFNITNEVRHIKQLKSHLSSISQKINHHSLIGLTKTQTRVITQLCEGKTVRSIAQTLNRSYHTVDNHKRAIFKKLGINKMQQLVAFAKENGLV